MECREKNAFRNVVAAGDEGDAAGTSGRLGGLEAFNEKRLLLSELMGERVLPANDQLLRRGRRCAGGRQFERPVRGGEILANLHRRDRESFTDLVETGAAAVGRQHLLHPQPGHGQQVLERVFIFRAGEPADRGPTVAGPGRDIGGQQPRVEAVEKGPPVGLGNRPCLARRWHLATGHAVVDPGPSLDRLPVSEVVAERLDGEAAFGTAVGMTLAAVRRKKGPPVADQIRGGGPAGHRTNKNQQRGQRCQRGPHERHWQPDHRGEKPRSLHHVHSRPASRPVPSENASTSNPIRCSIEV